MGFQGMGSAPKYLCLSTVVKPVTGHGIETGAIVIETDTGNEFRFDGTAWVQLTGSYLLQDAVIAINGTVSSEIDFRNYKYLSFLMPAAWDAATLTIKGSAVAGGTKVNIKNDTNTTFPAMTVAVGTIYSVDVNALMTAGVHYLALVASAAQTTAARTIKVMCKA